MALVNFSALVTSVKGSVGGITFSSTRSGTAVKRRLTGRKSVSSKQLRALSLNKQSLTDWSILGFGPRQSWSDYASVYTFTDRFGVTKALTGLNWFVLVNYNRVFFGLSVVTVPPTHVLPDSLPSFFLTMDATSMVVEWSTTVDDSTTAIMVFASGPTKSQAQYNRGKYLLLGLITSDYSNSFAITSLWEDVTGLNYASTMAAGLLNVNVMIVPISKMSYISGLGQTATSQVPRSGVGYMAIGSTFVVS